MKRLLPSLFLLFCSYLTVLSQSPPESFKYQSIVRDASGNMLDNQAVNFQFTLIQGTTNGTTVYQEVFPVTTNNYGLFNVQIGDSDPSLFSTLDWVNNSYYLGVAINNILISTQLLVAVPFALHASSASQTANAATVNNSKTRNFS